MKVPAIALSTILTYALTNYNKGTPDNSTNDSNDNDTSMRGETCRSRAIRITNVACRSMTRNAFCHNSTGLRSNFCLRIGVAGGGTGGEAFGSFGIRTTRNSLRTNSPLFASNGTTILSCITDRTPSRLRRNVSLSREPSVNPNRAIRCICF